MNVPLLDLKAQFATIRADVMAAVTKVFESQYFILGPEVAEFERVCAAYLHVPHALGVSSGTDALLLALMALDIGPGDEVITTPYSFFATAACVTRLGAKPVFVDIEPTTFNIDVTKLADAITAKTKAIIPVHLFGQCVDMDPLLALARAHNLAVVEDAAQAIGSRYKDRYAGGMGTIGCFSFFPSKNLGGAGDGGLVTTNDANLHDKLTRLRVHGMEPKYYHALVGGNFRLDALQAAVLRVKLPYLDAWHEGRRRNAARYDALFEKHPAIVTPRILPACYSIYNQYVIRVPQRDKVLTALKQQNIGCEVYYPLALHTQQCFAFLGYAPGAFPEAERAARETLALPIYPELTEEQQRHVAAAVIAAIA